jgi:hypothetical protein
MGLFCLSLFCMIVTSQQHSPYKLDFLTSYNQFYLFDKGSPGATDSNGFWTDDAFNSRLAVGDGILGVGTESYGHIRAELFVLERERTNVDYEQFDHIVDGAIEIKSGVLQILDCPTSEIELEIRLKPGSYHVRVYSSNLTGVISDENEGKDRYMIEIWPDSYVSRRVIKQFKPNYIKH